MQRTRTGVRQKRNLRHITVSAWLLPGTCMRGTPAFLLQGFSRHSILLSRLLRPVTPWCETTRTHQFLLTTPSAPSLSAASTPAGPITSTPAQPITPISYIISTSPSLLLLHRRPISSSRKPHPTDRLLLLISFFCSTLATLHLLQLHPCDPALPLVQSVRPITFSRGPRSNNGFALKTFMCRKVVTAASGLQRLIRR